MRKERDPFFDVTKALAIMLVVFCHVAGMAPQGTFPIALENFRVGMNMPIFFVISGYFAWPTIEAVNWKKLGRHLQSYFQPALFFSCVFLSIGLAIGVVPVDSNSIAVAFIRGIFVDPWFITTLAECYVLTFVAHAVWRTIPRMLGILCVVILAVVFRPTTAGTIHCGCIVNMLPCFLFGALVLRKLSLKLWESKLVGLGSLAIFLAFVALEGNVHTNGMSFYNADVSYRALANVRGGVTFMLRPIIGIIGSIGVMSLLRLALDCCPRLNILAPLGTMTLGIYIFHLWPLERLKAMNGLVTGYFSLVMVTLGLLTISAFVTWVLTKKIGKCAKFIWGK